MCLSKKIEVCFDFCQLCNTFVWSFMTIINLKQKSMGVEIQKEGSVEGIDGCLLKVKIAQTSACSACEARSFCMSSERKEKTVDVPVPAGSTYRVGQRVVVQESVSMGFRAVLVAYCVPLVLLIAVLGVAYLFTGSEGLSALLSLLSVAVYYLALWCLRARLKRTFSFKLVEPSGEGSELQDACE
jgi:sigma-E factor negative regulatory protein RseC